MQQTRRIKQIVDEKCKSQNLSIRALARRSGIKNHSQIIRLLSGQAKATPSMLEKLCVGLGCSREERIEIFHAAGYLAPDETDEMAGYAA